MLFQKFFPLNTQNHFGIVLYTTFEGLVTVFDFIVYRAYFVL